jgi:hypothetical protein
VRAVADGSLGGGVRCAVVVGVVGRTFVAAALLPAVPLGGGVLLVHGLGVVVRAFAVLALLAVGSVALLLPGAVSVAPVPAVSGTVAALLARPLAVAGPVAAVAGPVLVAVLGTVVVAGGVLLAIVGPFAVAFGGVVAGVLRVLGRSALGDERRG